MWGTADNSTVVHDEYPFWDRSVLHFAWVLNLYRDGPGERHGKR